ncbi:hypothetical protein NL676_027829 [Syzygium grande]|nr:hypothetical protein NL676_027829 [Syzygium grande]
MQRAITTEEMSFIRQDDRKGQLKGGAEEEQGAQVMMKKEEETEEMAEEYAEPEFEKYRKVGGVIPPKKRSVKRMIWDRAASCFTASCLSSPPRAFQTQEKKKKKKKTVVPPGPPPPRRIFALPNY